MTTADVLERRAFEVADVPDVKPRDYVRFHAHLENEVHTTTEVDRHGNPKTSNRKIAVLIEQGGGGQVLRMNATPKTARVPGREDSMRFTVARVDAGKPLGVVLAVLNGAELAGEQTMLEVGA